MMAASTWPAALPRYQCGVPLPLSDPRVIEIYENGRTIASALGDLGNGSDFGDLATRGRAEKAVVKLLERQGDESRQ
jgi:hypothetical protein